MEVLAAASLVLRPRRRRDLKGSWWKGCGKVKINWVVATWLDQYPMPSTNSPFTRCVYHFFPAWTQIFFMFTPIFGEGGFQFDEHIFSFFFSCSFVKYLWYIYLHLVNLFMVNVGKYLSNLERPFPPGRVAP